MPDKLCKQCRYHKRSIIDTIFFRYIDSRCTNPRLKFIDEYDKMLHYVGGSTPQYSYPLCTTMRMYHDQCGHEGRYYKEK